MVGGSVRRRCHGRRRETGVTAVSGAERFDEVLLLTVVCRRCALGSCPLACGAHVSCICGGAGCFWQLLCQKSSGGDEGDANTL